jgi:uncharacterized membrane protein (GlpM family)
MTAHGLLVPVFQATLCFAVVALLRLAIVYLGSRLGGILVGTPMLVFPLLAMQAWLGPPLNQDQTIGSVASITSVAFAFWSMWLPIGFSPLAALATMASAWFLVLSILYMTGVPAAAMAAGIMANAAFILIRYRDHQPAVAPSRGKLGEAAVPTAIFLCVFFLVTQIVPDFVRGVLVMFPIGLLVTLYFVRTTVSNEAFRNFVTYSHGAITATAAFVITVHFTIAHMPSALSLGLGLLVSIATSILISQIWRAPIVSTAAPPDV